MRTELTKLWKVVFWPEASQSQYPEEEYIACESIHQAVDLTMLQWPKSRVIHVHCSGRVLVNDLTLNDRPKQP